MTSINWKVFSRAFHSHWDCENRWRIDGDMAEWSLWYMIGKQSLSINAPVNNLGPYILHPSLTNPSLNTPLFSNNSALHSTKTLSAYTIWRNTYGYRCSLENMPLTSARMLSVQRGQLSHKGLPPPLGYSKVNYRTKGGTDWRLNGPKGYSRGRESLL